MAVRPRAYGVAALAAAALGTVCIVGTYARLSYTWDEGTHVYAGLEVFEHGRYTFQTENPPLSRLTIALWPWLDGATVHEASAISAQTPFSASDRLFHRSEDHVTNVTQARVGNLPWFWACLWLAWTLAGGRRTPGVAALATAAVATTPVVVGHAGFATTDVPFVAAFLLALVALRRFLRQPDARGAVACGAALGFAVATKFSTLVFLPPVVVAIVGLHYWAERRRWVALMVSPIAFRRLATMALVAAVTIWASYGFRVGRMADLPERLGPYGTFPSSGAIATAGQWPIPAHEFFHGLVFLQTHTAAGHRSTLFGEFSQRGFWYYYPVVLGAKTPVPLMLFLAGGLYGLWRHRERPGARWCLGLAVGGAGLMAVAMTSPINIGSRHVIVLVPVLAIPAAAGWPALAGRLDGALWRRWTPAALVTAQAALLVTAFPYQSSYFNVLAGRDPGYISSDSDFDWGQDGLAFVEYLGGHPVPDLQVQLQGSANWCRFDLPPLKALTTTPEPGWIAVSERQYRLNRGGRTDPCAMTAAPLNAPPGWLDWLHARRPDAVVGKTIRLYHVTADDLPAATRSSSATAPDGGR